MTTTSFKSLRKINKDPKAAACLGQGVRGSFNSIQHIIIIIIRLAGGGG